MGQEPSGLLDAFVQLVNNPTIITTIADVTFYGQDLVGNEIQATGSIQVDFGNFADR